MKILARACCMLVAPVLAMARADVVTEWNTLHLDAIRNESISPPLAARNLAIVHASIYDAVNAIRAVMNPIRLSRRFRRVR